MSRAKTFFLIFFTIFFSIIIYEWVSDDKKEKKEETPKKIEMMTHYGKSGGVELLKISDNNWRLENSNGYFVTIRRVEISSSHGAGETTQSEWKICIEHYTKY